MKMTTLAENAVNDKTEPLTCNSDGALIFEELYLKCQALENEKLKLLAIRENLLILTEKNENISKRLLKIKTELDLYKSHLYKILFNLRMSTDKQKILSRKNLDDFQRKTQDFQEYYKVSSKKYELENLFNKNRHLQEEWEKKSELFELTKKQHVQLENFIIKSFQNKICEFCDTVLRISPANT